MNAPMTQVAAAAAQAAEASEFTRLMQADYSPRNMLEGNNLDKALMVAEKMATAKVTVPKHLLGSVGDCLAIVTQAMLWNMNPFAVAQKTHLVNGVLGYEAQLVNAVVQNSGAVRGAPHYEYRGDGAALECRVGFVLRGQTDITWGEYLRKSDVTTQNSPLWKTNPKQQLGYLQVKNWARAYAPGAILGVYTTDELDDSPVGARPMNVDPATGEIKPPPAPPPVLPPISPANFERNLPAWTKAVADGKKTAQDVLTTLQSKASFTDEQKAVILALKKAVPVEAHVPPVDDDFIAAMDRTEIAQ